MISYNKFSQLVIFNITGIIQIVSAALELLYELILWNIALADQLIRFYYNKSMGRDTCQPNYLDNHDSQLQILSE